MDLRSGFRWAVLFAVLGISQAAHPSPSWGGCGPLGPTLPNVPALPQTAGTLWGKVFGGPGMDEASLVKALEGGGYLLGGATSSFGAGGKDLLLVKIDASGAVLWAKSYGTSDDETGAFFPLPGGGLLAEGVSVNAEGHYVFFLVRLDEDGAILWQKTYGGPDSGLYGGPLLEDGGALINGFSFSYGTLNSSVKVLRVDGTGEILWQKDYTTPGIVAGGFLEDSDHTPVAFGVFTDLMTSNPDLWAAKFDATGNLLWQKTYGGGDVEAPSLLWPLPEGGYLLSGNTLSFGAGSGDRNQGDLWLLRLDDNGDVVWQKTYGGAGDEYGLPYPIPEGGFFLAAFTDSFGAGGDDLWILKLDAGGEPVWQKTFGGPFDDIPTGVHPLADQGALVSAQTESFGRGGEDTWLIRLDAAGLPTFQKTYGGTDGDNACVHVLPDGGFFLSGRTASFRPTDLDLFAFRTDADGAVGPSCPWIQDTSAETSVPPMTSGITAAWIGSPGLTERAINYGWAPMNLTVSEVSIEASDLCSAVAPLAASASGAPLSGSAPLVVDFSAFASGGTPPYAYAWDFGDGSGSSAQNPSHTFTTEGTYPVTLTVTDGTGASATDAHLSISVQAPACSLTCSALVPSSAQTHEAVTFDGSATVSGCAETPSFEWDFGDGTPHGTSPTATHAYAAPGSYDWTLTVRLPGVSPCVQTGTLVVTAPAVPPPVVGAITKKGNPFRFVVTGSNLQSGIQVFIEGQLWSQVTWKNTGKVVIKGGASLKAAVPKDTPRTFRFLNPDGGEATVVFQWP